MGMDDKTRARVMKLKRTELCDGVVGGFDLIVSRTGYTGEKMAFELFVHPERAVDFWNTILKAGEPFGVKPIGLGARDSLRTEAGLPLYGDEMGLGSGKHGHRDLGVAEGGFGSYVKPYKPWFIGREAYVARERNARAWWYASASMNHASAWPITATRWQIKTARPSAGSPPAPSIASAS